MIIMDLEICRIWKQTHLFGLLTHLFLVQIWYIIFTACPIILLDKEGGHVNNIVLSFKASIKAGKLEV